MNILLSLILFIASSYANPNVIYGEDSRQDLWEITDPDVLETAHSTLAFSIKGLILQESNGDYKVTTTPLRGFHVERQNELPNSLRIKMFIAARNFSFANKMATRTSL